MVNNKIQFAVVREDPLIEAEVLKSGTPQKVLLIASGGCTAFTLQALFPDLEITLLDPNPHQISLIEKKLSYLNHYDEKETKLPFNVGVDDPAGLNECGNFESLFRGLRNFIYEFVIPQEELREMFCARRGREEITERMFNNKFWKVAFDLYFSDSLLHAFFGPEATQNAPAGSYPSYFKDILERGLGDDSAYDNYFLHHILLGHYIDDDRCLPVYLSNPCKSFRIQFVTGYFDAVDHLEQYDLVQLSNIFDWMTRDDIDRIAEKVNREMKTGAVLMFRQLNNTVDYSGLFKNHFRFDRQQENTLLKKDRSLFYNKLNIGVKV